MKKPINYKNLKKFKTKNAIIYNFNNPFYDIHFLTKKEIMNLEKETLINLVICLDPMNKIKDKHWYVVKGIVTDNTERYIEIKYNDHWEIKIKKTMQIFYTKIKKNGTYPRYYKEERVDYNIYL